MGTQTVAGAIVQADEAGQTVAMVPTVIEGVDSEGRMAPNNWQVPLPVCPATQAGRSELNH